MLEYDKKKDAQQQQTDVSQTTKNQQSPVQPKQQAPAYIPPQYSDHAAPIQMKELGKDKEKKEIPTHFDPVQAFGLSTKSYLDKDPRSSLPAYKHLPIQKKENKTGLPDNLKEGVENLSGISMDDVKVHYNSSKPSQLKALAYAQGTEIHLGTGQEKHLPHEAWHVVQQKQGRVKSTVQMNGMGINNNKGLENEADVMGQKARMMQMKKTDFPTDLNEKQQNGNRVLQRNTYSQTEVIQAQFAVQVVLDTDTLAISRVNIGGRPDGLLKGKEGSHTTAWAVFTDIIRKSTLGLSIQDALKSIYLLYEDLKQLPGYELLDSLEGDAAILHKEANKSMMKVFNYYEKAQKNKIPTYQIVALVQSAMEAYLSLRNAIPLTQIDDGRATGHGEPKHLADVRYANDVLKKHDKLDDSYCELVRKSMWSLLDYAVIKKMGAGLFTKKQAPGLSVDYEKSSTLVGAAIVQHLWTLNTAYKQAFEASNMEGEKSILNFLKNTMGYDEEASKAVYNKINFFYKYGEDPVAKDNHPILHDTQTDGGNNFGVKVDINQDGGKTVKVKNVYFGARPHGLLGSKEGSHLTAWIVFCDVVRTAIGNKSVIDAIKAILRLYIEAKKLPGVSRIKNLDEKAKPFYEASESRMEKAVLNTKKMKNIELQALPVLQELIAAYLSYRNSIPLSQTNAGVADGSGEAQSRARILYLNGNIKKSDWNAKLYGPIPTSLKDFWLAMWNMMDTKVLHKMALHEIEPADAPGLSKKDEFGKVAADLIIQHLKTMKLAYPVAFVKTGMGKITNVILFLKEQMHYHNEAIENIRKNMK